MDLDGHRRPNTIDHYVLDELTHYATVLSELFHELKPCPMSCRSGRPRNPERIVDADLDYATVHKTRLGSWVIKVERHIMHGSESRALTRLEKSPSHTINTAYVERSNLDWRL